VLSWPPPAVAMGILMLNRWFKLAAMLISVMLAATSIAAHDLPTSTVMNAFVKIEPDQAHLVVRVPLDLLRGAPFPAKGGQYDLAAVGPAIRDTLSAVSEALPIRENGVQLVPSGATGRLSLPSDRSFEDYQQALAVTSQATDTRVAIYYDQGYLDAHFVYPISSPKSVFTIQSEVAADLRDRAKLTIRYLPLNESGRAMMISSGSGPVALNPSWYQAAGGFVALGIQHILSGADHLLFLFCLIIPFRRLKGLIPVITAFTLGHSVTLLGTAYNLGPRGAWFPPFVETAIAASIVYMALENVVGTDLRRRWMVTGLFGLVHGFGFSYALKQDLQFAGKHLLVSLLSFNIGIELGQLTVLAAMLAVLALLFRVRALAGRVGVILLSAIVAHTAWHWMLERGEVLWQSELPRLDGASLMVLARWVAALLLAVGGARLLANWVERKWPSGTARPVLAPEKAEIAAVEIRKRVLTG
jgi:hypothetical protein